MLPQMRYLFCWTSISEREKSLNAFGGLYWMCFSQFGVCSIFVINSSFSLGRFGLVNLILRKYSDAFLGKSAYET